MNAFESIKIALAEAQLLGLDPAKAGSIRGCSFQGGNIQFHYKAPELFNQGNWTKEQHGIIAEYKHPTYATTFVFSAN